MLVNVIGKANPNCWCNNRIGFFRFQRDIFICPAVPLLGGAVGVAVWIISTVFATLAVAVTIYKVIYKYFIRGSEHALTFLPKSDVSVVGKNITINICNWT